MNPRSAPPDIARKFMRRHPGWFHWVRHPLFIAFTFVVLIAYALISIIELLKAGLSQKSLLANPSPLIFVTALYLVMFVPLTRFSGLLEKKMKASQRQVRL